jgi:hypothetical protein
MDCSVTKISRMETGERGLYVDDVSAILGFLQAPGKLREELLDLVRTGQERNWHALHGKLPTSWQDLIDFEREATIIRNYQPLMIPGLAQTSEYARTLIEGGHETLTEDEAEALVNARMSRQVVLSRSEPPMLHLMVEEMVLRRTMGNPIMMYGQLQHLVGLGRRRNITLHVVPFDVAPAVAVQGPLLILEFQDHLLAYEETRGTSTFLEEREHIARTRLMWQKLRAAALAPGDSERLIAGIADKLRS